MDEDQIRYLHQLRMYEATKVQALVVWVNAHLEKLTGKPKAELSEAFNALHRDIYDEQITSIGDTDPSYAEYLDLRPDLPGGYSDQYQFPREWWGSQKGGKQAPGHDTTS